MRRGTLYLAAHTNSPYSPSRQHDEDHLDREDWDAYDLRTWKLHCTTNHEGHVVIPQMALKQCLDSAASKVGQKVKGRGGNMTYKGFFMSGLNIQQDLTLLNGEGPFTLDDAAMVTINSHANGQRGSAKRVKRRFPVFYDWHATADVYIFDDLLTPELVDEHVEIGGMLVGLGRFRPQNGGVNGRFRLVKSEWQDVRI